MKDVDVIEVEKKLARVLFILESDKRTNQQGLVEKVSSIETKLIALLTREKVYKAKATTWGVIGGIASTLLFWIGKFVIGRNF